MKPNNDPTKKRNQLKRLPPKVGPRLLSPTISVPRVTAAPATGTESMDLDTETRALQAYLEPSSPFLFVTTHTPGAPVGSTDAIDERVLVLLGRCLSDPGQNKEIGALTQRISPTIFALAAPFELRSEFQWLPKLREGIRLMNGDTVKAQSMSGFSLGMFYMSSAAQLPRAAGFASKLTEIYGPSEFIQFCHEDEDADPDADPWVMPFLELPHAVLRDAFPGLVATDGFAAWYRRGREEAV